MLIELLDRGFFPKELPPIFSTSSFAMAIDQNGSVLPEACVSKRTAWTKSAHHNLARVGGLRRRLSVPNPLTFYWLARAFAEHKDLLAAKWSESSWSGTKPELVEFGGRALDRAHGDRAVRRATARVGAKYVLKADVAQFYPSIYTHSVSWALHGKSQAKAATKDTTLAGNVIDKTLQACQNGQTKGIAIGPDTSLGIAELILAPIDARLRAECSPIGGVRFIDDMEYSFRKLADAENAMYRLEEYLHEYDLQLNATKTSIATLPESLESRFVIDLRRALPAAKDASRAMWIDFFSLAFDAAKRDSQDGVLRYAISALSKVAVPQKLWPLVQSLLWQTLASDVGCLRFIIDYVWIQVHANSELILDKEMACEAISALITDSAPVGHGSEVAWSMWAAILFSLRLTDDAWNAASSMDDSFVAVSSMQAATHLGHPLNSAKWCAWLEEGCFREDQWLFAYEAFRNGWCTDQLAFAKLNTDPFCKFLCDKEVSFINKKTLTTYRPSRLLILSSGGGGSG